MLCDLNCGFLPLFSGEVLITVGVWGRAGSQASPPSHGDEGRGRRWGSCRPTTPPRSTRIWSSYGYTPP